MGLANKSNQRKTTIVGSPIKRHTHTHRVPFRTKETQGFPFWGNRPGLVHFGKNASGHSHVKRKRALLREARPCLGGREQRGALHCGPGAAPQPHESRLEWKSFVRGVEDHVPFTGTPKVRFHVKRVGMSGKVKSCWCKIGGRGGDCVKLGLF